MTFTYSFSDNSTLAKVRLWIGDITEDQGVKPDGSNFSDEELQSFLDANDDDVILTVIDLCDVLAVQFSNFGDTEIGTRREKIGQVALRYEMMGNSLRERYGIGYAGKAVPTIRVDGYSNDISNIEVEDLDSGEF